MAEHLQFKKSNCKNCYKCIRHCPVKAIRFSNDQANIIAESCILCGNCFLNCPQNAKEIRRDVEQAKNLIASGVPVYVSLAPSFVANYNGVKLPEMQEALQQLGFAAAEETAVGATLVKKQYEEMTKQGKQSVIISSCCHTVNLLIQKYYPAALPLLAPVITPMNAHCMDIKQRFPHAKTVFIGPCLSKKAEADIDGHYTDCVLTFEELTEWLAEENITLQVKEDTSQKGRARFFPTAGGILKSMNAKSEEYDYIAVDGLENCMHALEDILQNRLSHCFIEMSACTGSCIGGPAMDKVCRSSVQNFIEVNRYAKKEDFDTAVYTQQQLQTEYPSLAIRNIAPGAAAITDILRQMGKTKPEDELNCGSCGYNTCRDKARAVLEGKANISMCLPFLKEKAESFSDNIIKNTPNAILVMDEELQIQQINDAACTLLGIDDRSNVMGEHVVNLLDPTPFIDAFEQEKNLYDCRATLPDYEKCVEQTVIYDRNFHIIICIMRDVTQETEQKQQKEAMQQKTMEIADNVIAKQMRTVQEIASLLGETTAETKLALTRLKESMNEEG